MARFTPTDVTSSYAAIAALNANFDDIASLMGKCVFRDGTAPNAMETALDLNHNRVQNVADGVDETDAVNLSQLRELAVNGGAVVITNETAFARRLSFGPKVAVRTLRKALDASDTISSQIVGYAASTTGGNGKTKYIVNNESQDASVENSYYWALAQARANGGGCIVFDPRGHLNIRIFDNTHRVDFNNLTIIAPGRNVTFWTSTLTGSFIVGPANNVIIAYCEFRTMPGVLAVYTVEAGKTEQKLVTVDPSMCDLIAFVGCEFRHASDGALDMASGALLIGSPQCRVTVQDFIFWDTDQPMGVGSADQTCFLGSPGLLKLTLHNGIFAYCGERQPKVSGRTTVDMSNIYTLTLPFQRDQLSPVNEFSTCYGVAALDGGTVTARGCLWTAASGSGYNAIYTAPDPNGVSGAANAIDCAAENSMLIIPANTSFIPALPYTLAHDPVPAVGQAREDWIAERWATCGARVDSAPEGIFAWTADTTAYPNGETVLVDRNLGGRWLRIDTQPEFQREGQSQYNYVNSGAFTPTLTAVVNCSGLAVARANYQQVGNRVSVSATITGTLTTTATSTSIGISLPVASNFGVTSDVQGVCRTVSSTNQVGGYVNADTANDRAQLTITPTIATGGAFIMSLDFYYMVI